MSVFTRALPFRPSNGACDRCMSSRWRTPGGSMRVKRSVPTSRLATISSDKAPTFSIFTALTGFMAGGASGSRECASFARARNFFLLRSSFRDCCACSASNSSLLSLIASDSRSRLIHMVNPRLSSARTISVVSTTRQFFLAKVPFVVVMMNSTNTLLIYRHLFICNRH